LKLAKSQKTGIATPSISNFINTPETGALSTFIQELTFLLHMQTSQIAYGNGSIIGENRI